MNILPNQSVRTLDSQSQKQAQSMELEGSVENEIIIYPSEGPQNTYYKLNESGGKIGRHSANQIVIMEESVSRSHAEILYQASDFFIKDLESSTGSFIKIQELMLVEEAAMIEMGSNQFKVMDIKYGQESVEVQLHIYDGPQKGDPDIMFCLSPSQSAFKIGRNKENHFRVLDDYHLSSFHARFFYQNHSVFLEDLSSTNGTWKRISGENTPSEAVKLKDGDHIKIGLVSTFKI